MTDTPAPTPQSSNPSSNGPTDVGAILKQARLRRGQSFEVVFQHTRIPKKFLEALEANRFDEFPAAVYLQGFLKGYCEHLDLDFEPLWSQVHPSQPKQTEAEKESRPAEPAPAPAPRSESARTPAPRPASAPSAPAVPLAAIGIAAAIAIILAVFWTMPKSGSKPPTAPPLAAQHPAVPVVQHPPEPLPPVVLAPKKMTLQLTFRNEAWLSLRCDGKLRFEGRGPAGFTQTWTAMKEFSIRTSNPDDLNLNLDGRELKLGSELKSASGEYVVKRT